MILRQLSPKQAAAYDRLNGDHLVSFLLHRVTSRHGVIYNITLINLECFLKPIIRSQANDCIYGVVLLRGESISLESGLTASCGSESAEWSHVFPECVKFTELNWTVMGQFIAD